MKPSDLYKLPPTEKSTLLYRLRDHLPEIDFYRIREDSCQGLEFNIYADHSFDGERTWSLGAVFLDGVPFMVIQNAGRGGRDHSDRFITNQEVFTKAIVRLMAMYSEEQCDLVDPNTDVPALTEFYGHQLGEFYDPELKPKYKVGDVVIANVLEDHLSYTNKRTVATRVLIQGVVPMHPTRTYQGKQLDRSYRFEGGKSGPIDTPNEGTLGAWVSDSTVIGYADGGENTQPAQPAASALTLPDISHYDLRALPWRPMTQSEYDEFCDFDGDLADRWGAGAPADIHVASLPITEGQAAALMAFDGAMVEGFNSLDIQLKERFAVSVVIFVDYDAGTARVVKPASFEIPV